MKPLLNVFIVTACIIAFSFRHATNPVFITGHLKDNPDETTKGLYSALIVFAANGKKVVGKTTSDANGNFQLVFTPTLKDTFDLYCCGVGMDTLLLESITSFNTDNPEMSFYLPAKPHKNALGKVVCPRCNKADKIYKVVHSIAPVVTAEVNKSGDTTYSPLYKGTYQAGCIFAGAKYYCDRDKVKF